jgi:hypothetical protein
VGSKEDKFANIGGSPAEVDMSECGILAVPVNIRIPLHSFASFSIYMHSLPPPHVLGSDLSYIPCRNKSIQDGVHRHYSLSKMPVERPILLH